MKLFPSASNKIWRTLQELDGSEDVRARFETHEERGSPASSSPCLSHSQDVLCLRPNCQVHDALGAAPQLSRLVHREPEAPTRLLQHATDSSSLTESVVQAASHQEFYSLGLLRLNSNPPGPLHRGLQPHAQPAIRKRPAQQIPGLLPPQKMLTHTLKACHMCTVSAHKWLNKIIRPTPWHDSCLEPQKSVLCLNLL